MAVPTNGIFDDHHHDNDEIQTEEILQNTVNDFTENSEQDNLPYTEDVSVEHADGDGTSIRDLDKWVEVLNEVTAAVEVTAEDDDLLTQDL